MARRRHHIDRVRKLARTLAAREQLQLVDSAAQPPDMEIVELAALLHDIADWKYSGSETAGVERAREWLRTRTPPMLSDADDLLFAAAAAAAAAVAAAL